MCRYQCPEGEVVCVKRLFLDNWNLAIGTWPLFSTDMCSLNFHVDRIQRLATHHEDAIAFRSAETEIAANLRYADLSNSFSVGRENMDAVVAITDPTGTGPDIPVDVRPDAVGEANLVEPVQLHRYKLGAVR